jgi:formate dehydrogenase major subunit
VTLRTVGKQNHRLASRLVFFIVAFVGLPLVFLRYMSVGTFCFLDPFFGFQFLSIGVGQTFGFTEGNALVLVGVTVGILVVLTLIMGRAFCSWICPFGTWLDGVGSIRPTKEELPDAYILNALRDRNIKYGLLVGFLGASAAFGGYFFCAVCPIGATARIAGPAFGIIPALMILPLLFFVGFSYVAYKYEPRMWCKYYCPLGGLLAFLDKFSWHRVQLELETCIECRRCERACPMDIPIMEETRYKMLQDPEVREAVGATDDNPDPLYNTNFHFLPDDVKEVLRRKAKQYRIPPGECIRCYQCTEVCEKATKTAMKEEMLDPDYRKTNFEEVAHGYTEEQAVAEADRCLNCVDAPCRLTCPANIDVPVYIKQIRERDFRGSLETVIERAPLPGTLGRVCPAPCQDVCRRGKKGEAIQIRLLKRFVSDQYLETRSPVIRDPPTGKRVAIVGSGPAGLTVAYRLALKGHDIEIFEELSVLGGMLRVGIPDYRLPPEVLEKEIYWIRDQGAKFHLSTSIGREVTLEKLMEDFDAVLLAVGAHRPKTLRLEGEDRIEGVMSATQFLKDVNLGEEVLIGRRVGVVGGGNVAMDCLRTSVRLGAQKVYCVYRRAREQMPANDIEIVESMEEGIEFLFLNNPTKLYEEDGKLTGVQLLKMELGEPDSSGRRRPVPVEGSEYDVGLDWIIPAISQEPILEWLPEELGIDLTRWNTFAVDKNFMTTRPGVFACGDDELGPATVIEAIAQANRTANGMHKYLMGGKK